MSRERLCVIVAREHRRYWQKALTPLSGGSVIVQPRNRGTAKGILLSALWILAQDSDAYIAFLPSDHHVADETMLAQALKRASALTVRYPEELLLIGVEPEEADPELGYLVPSGGAGEARRVTQFVVEKPSADSAGELIADGALWNTFIFIARGRLLLDLLRERVPRVVQAMGAAVLWSPTFTRSSHHLISQGRFCREGKRGCASSGPRPAGGLIWGRHGASRKRCAVCRRGVPGSLSSPSLRS